MGLSGVGKARKAACDRENVSAYPCREFRPISLMRSDITLPEALSTSPLLLAAPLIRLGPANGTPHSEGMQNRTTIHLHTQTASSCRTLVQAKTFNGLHRVSALSFDCGLRLPLQ